MQKVFDESRSPFDLGDKLGGGGEGVVWRLNSTTDFVVKIYHARPTQHASDKQRILQQKVEELKGCAALPVSLAFADPGLKSHVGIFMRFVGGHEVHELYGTRSRAQHFPNATFKFLVCAASNLASAFEELHKRNILVGDVNEKNIKILPDATSRFIDCDSFQVSNGTRVFASDVGTPLWTPPELHGQNLTGFSRTKNHDLFGLAQMIFFLLFSGRHPFSGKWSNNIDVPPEEAIRSLAFAYAPVSLNIPVRPPPGAPGLEMLPQAIQTAFLEAFLGTGSHRRPDSSKWRLLMQTLNTELVTCQHNQQHVFWRGAPKCPWCKIFDEVRFDIFPAKTVAGVKIETKSKSGYRIVPSPFPYVITNPPPVTALKPTGLPVQPSGFLSSLHKVISPKGWKQGWLSPRINEFRRTLGEIEKQIQQYKSEQQTLISNYRRDFLPISGKLKAIFDELNDSAATDTRMRDEFEKERRNNEMNAFLQKFYVRNFSIPQVGPARRATLLSFGIETAGDVTPSSLSRANIPSNAVTELLDWRKELEIRFKYDQNRPLTQPQLGEIRGRVNKLIANQNESATALEVKLNALNATTLAKFRNLDAKLIQLNARKDQLKVDIDHLSQLV